LCFLCHSRFDHDLLLSGILDDLYSGPFAVDPFVWAPDLYVDLSREIYLPSDEDLTEMRTDALALAAVI